MGTLGLGRFLLMSYLQRVCIVSLLVLLGGSPAGFFGKHAITLSAAPPIGNFKATEVKPMEEAYLFTPLGFDGPGKIVVAEGELVAHLHLTILDKATGRPTPCRINVVGPEGNYYQPEGDLQPYGFTNNWPKEGSRGNRLGKGPFRYLGWYFYTRGEVTVDIPAGKIRIEIWKGFEYRPITHTVEVAAGETYNQQLTLEQTLPMREHGYFAGDPHIHVPRRNQAEDKIALDLMEAEGIYYGSILCYNEPPGPYTGVMNTQDMPQAGLGSRSLRWRGDYEIVSGQEYRSQWYGHLNLHMHDALVLKGQSLNADDGPIFGELAQQTRDEGGVAVFAHGGYALEVYADVIQEKIDAVEMLQFSKYRGIGLEHWYHFLNAGFRVPMTGASDYPACRKLGDCKTYVYHAELPGFGAWYRGMADGQSFVTSGPMLLLEVNGERPGATISQTAPGTHEVTVRLNSEVVSVSHLRLIVGGRVAKEVLLQPTDARGKWYELKQTVPLDHSSWIAARAFSKSPGGSADAESHTNPVYVIHKGKAPYQHEAVDVLLKELDRQIAFHQTRNFKEKRKILAYFLKSKDILQEIHKTGGRRAQDDEERGDLSRVDANRDAVAGDEKSLREVLRSIPAKSPDEALATFNVVEPFHMELVAHEPLVTDPICAAIDENGLMYVGEMTDYPYFPQSGEKPIGGVCVLEDTDKDGRYDKSTRFAEELLWVSGIAPWKGGVYIASPPDIWYLKDTNGDHQADVQRRVFTGFGKQNQQGMLNNLQWGPDHKIYGSTSVNGGQVRHVNDPDAEVISIAGHDFRFDPESEVLEAISGTKQFGNSFDDWGNRFVCSQGRPLLHVVLPQRYLARNPYLTTATALNDIAPVPTPVFRTSPVEMWREIRSRRRIFANRSPATGTGVSHHVIDAGAGVTVYRGGAYPAQYYGSVFIGGAQNNLVHRRTLATDGVTFTSQRGEAEREFVQSTDNWFRPVNFLNAPDGTLYVLDMAREILEAIHIPLDVVKHLDLRSGRDRGRIYRIAPAGFQNPPPPRLGQASVEELVAALESPHGWWRDTARRLIFERQNVDAVEPLQRMLVKSKLATARISALWSLQGLAALREEDLIYAIGDEVAEIRAAAIRLAEPYLGTPTDLQDRVLDLAIDKSARVRFQLVFTLGEINDMRATEILADYAKKYAEDPWMQTAVLSSISSSTGQLLMNLLCDNQFASNRQGRSMLEQMGRMVGAKNETAATSRVLEVLAGNDAVEQDRGLQRLLLLAIGKGLKLAGKRLDTSTISAGKGAQLAASLTAEAWAVAQDSTADLQQRHKAIQLLACTPLVSSGEVLSEFLAAEHPLELQLAALDALGDYQEAAVAEIVTEHWAQYTPEVLTRAIRTLLGRESWTLTLLEAAEQGELSLSQLDSTQRDRLLKNSNGAVQELAQQLFGGDRQTPRGEIVKRYQASHELRGKVSQGEQVFTKTCAACHSVAGKGHAVGPDLTSIGSHDPEAMLVHILDPNRYVLPKYVQYVVQDDLGKYHTGLISSQTATSVTLMREAREANTILRSNIEAMQATQYSLMPEGLETKISEQAMADLLAYLADVRIQHGNSTDDNQQVERDFGTLPGLVEPRDRR
jgi:putative membrane-bound dehydrogenase-like protein